MKNDINYIDSLLKKASKKTNNAFLTTFDKIIEDFSFIKSEKDLYKFMKKYKIQNESLSTITFAFNQVFGLTKDKITLKGVILLTGNTFLKEYFNLQNIFEEETFIEKQEVELIALKIVDNLSSGYEDNLTDKSENLIYFIEEIINRVDTSKKENYLNNICDVILEKYKQNDLTMSSFEKIFEIFFNEEMQKKQHNSHFMPAIINKLLSVYSEKGNVSEIIPNFLKEKYRYCMSDIHLFNNLLAITGMNIKSPKFIFEIENANAEIFKKIIDEHSLKNFISHYNDLVVSNSNQYENKSAPLLFGNTGYYKTDKELEVLSMIIKKYDLQTITPDYQNMLDIFLTHLSSKDETKMKEFLLLLKEKYDYEYSYSFVYNNEYTTKVLPCSTGAHGEILLLDYVLKERLSHLEESVLKNLSMQIFHSLDFDLVEKLFENSETKNTVYTIFLNNFGNDKRRLRKLNASQEALELTRYVLSTEFIQSKHITLSNKEICDIISKRNPKIDENEIEVLFQRAFMENSVSLIPPLLKSNNQNRL